MERRFVYDGVDHPLWMWDRVSDAGVYFELDCIGNVRRLRGGARYGAGAALPSDLGGYKYSAFGRSIAADAGTPAPVVDGVSFAQPLRWQGRWLDTATGIYDVRNRQWSPELGAFLSPDEFELHGARGTLWSWPTQNPIRWRDPFGREPIPENLRWQLQPFFPEIDLGDVNVTRDSPSTFGNNAVQDGYQIDVRPGLDPFSGLGVRTLAHELVHVQQYEQFNRGRGWLGWLVAADMFKQVRATYPAKQKHGDRWWEYLATQWAAHVYSQIQPGPVCKD